MLLLIQIYEEVAFIGATKDGLLRNGLTVEICSSPLPDVFEARCVLNITILDCKAFSLESDDCKNTQGVDHQLLLFGNKRSVMLTSPIYTEYEQ